MKILKLFSLCAFIGLYTACTNEELTETISSEFKVVTKISAATRTPNLNANGAGHFEKGDQNSFFFHNNGEELLKIFTYIHGEKYFWNDINLPQGTATCQLSACYPTVNTETPTQFVWNVTTQDTPDFLIATPTNINVGTSTPVQLSFKHIMHKFCVEITSAHANITDDILNSAKVTLRNLQPAAQLNLLTGTSVAASGSLTHIEKLGKTTEFIIPSQQVGTMEVKVEMNNQVAIFQLSNLTVNGVALQKLDSGKSFTLKLEATQKDFIINGQDISGWGEQGSFDDTIII